MIAVLRPGTDRMQADSFRAWLAQNGCAASAVQVGTRVVVTLAEGCHAPDVETVKNHPAVEGVKQTDEPFFLVSRAHHPADRIVPVGRASFGGGHFQCIAGPCAIESAEQILQTAQAVKAGGATLLRGGAFKPRTSPYDFQGMGAEGLSLLKQAGRETGLPVVSELMDMRDLPLFEDVDLIQIGARNMQNYALLKELGSCGKPVLLKRGFANTLDEFLLSAEYIALAGNENIILCERGTRTFDSSVHHALDLSAVAVLKQRSCLPVVVDPSHAAGDAALVPALAMAAVAAGADGLMMEVHSAPACALCDGMQALLPDTFANVMGKVWQIRTVVAEQEGNVR